MALSYPLLPQRRDRLDGVGDAVNKLDFGAADAAE
jgi:hypothetical protein